MTLDQEQKFILAGLEAQKFSLNLLASYDFLAVFSGGRFGVPKGKSTVFWGHFFPQCLFDFYDLLLFVCLFIFQKERKKVKDKKGGKKETKKQGSQGYNNEARKGYGMELGE